MECARDLGETANSHLLGGQNCHLRFLGSAWLFAGRDMRRAPWRERLGRMVARGDTESIIVRETETHMLA